MTNPVAPTTPPSSASSSFVPSTSMAGGVTLEVIMV